MEPKLKLEDGDYEDLILTLEQAARWVNGSRSGWTKAYLFDRLVAGANMLQVVKEARK